MMLYLLSHSIFTKNLLILERDEMECDGKAYVVAKDDSALVVNRGKDGFLTYGK